jgi:hypothetical protein
MVLLCMMTCSRTLRSTPLTGMVIFRLWFIMGEFGEAGVFYSLSRCVSHFVDNADTFFH